MTLPADCLSDDRTTRRAAVAALLRSDLEVTEADVAELALVDRHAAEQLRRARLAPRKATARLRVALPDSSPGLAVLDASWPVPEGYSVDVGGVVRHAEGDVVVRVAHEPIAITSVWEDVDTKRQTVTLRWRSAQGIQERDVPREVALSGRELASLAGDGVPVGGDNAREIAA